MRTIERIIQHRDNRDIFVIMKDVAERRISLHFIHMRDPERTYVTQIISFSYESWAQRTEKKAFVMANVHAKILSKVPYGRLLAEIQITNSLQETEPKLDHDLTES